MTDEELSQYFQAGDIIFFFDDESNPPCNYSFTAQLLSGAQRWTEKRGNHRVIHVGLVHSVEAHDVMAGEAAMLIVDSMPGFERVQGDMGVKTRRLVRNYAIEIYRPNTKISGIDRLLLSQTALEIALELQGIGYSFQHCTETYTHAAYREEAELNEQYTTWLSERFLLDPNDRTIFPDKLKDGMNCAELVIICYQLAFLRLSNDHPLNETLPEWIRLHGHSSPARLHDFVASTGYYDRIGDDQTQALRYSGLPHPLDLSMAIIPWVDPATSSQQNTRMGWTEWLLSYLPPIPAVPGLSSAWSALNIFPTFWRTSVTPMPPEPVELKNTLLLSERHRPVSLTDTANINAMPQPPGPS